MASINSVTIDLQVKGEATATKSLKDFARAGKEVGTSVVKLANKVSAGTKEWSRLDDMLKRGLITENARRTAQAQLAAQMSSLTGLTEAQTRAALRNAQAARVAAAQAAADAATRQREIQSYNQLRSVIDQSYAARMRLKQAADTLRGAVRQGIITQEQAIEQLRRYRVAAQQAAAGGGFMGRNISRAGVLTQQAGYQVGDFIVQVQGGTNAFIAFGQQATQIAGTLTLLGGRYIALGTALGVTIPLLTALGAGLMRANVEADAIYEKFGFLEGSVRGLASAFGEAGGVIVNIVMTIVRNLDVFVSILGVAAVAAAVKFIAATSAMGTVVTSLGLMFLGAAGRADVWAAATTTLTAAMSRLMVVISAHPIIAAMIAALVMAAAVLYRARDAARGFRSSIEGLSGALKELRDNAKEAGIETARIELGVDTSAQAIARQRIIELDEQIAKMDELVEKKTKADKDGNVYFEPTGAIKRLNALIAEREEIEKLIKADQERIDNLERASARSSLDAIISSYDKQHAIQVKINDAEDKLNKAVELRLISAERMAEILQSYEGSLNDAADATGRIGFSGAISSANGLLGVLSRIGGVLGGILGQIGSIGFENVGKQAQVAALEAGKTVGQAGIEGRLAEERVRLESGSLGGLGVFGEMGINAAMLAKRKELEQGLQLDKQLKSLSTSTSGGGGGGTSKTQEDYLAKLQSEAELKLRLIGLTEEQQRYQEIVNELKDRELLVGGELSDQQEARIQQIINMEEETRNLMERQKERENLERKVQQTIESGLMSLLDGSASVEDAFKTMIRAILKEIAMKAIIEPIATGITGLFFEKGGAFNNGNVMPFANGGVVSSPTMFPMAGSQTGLMGEAGPEAIMPLKRGKGGKLGVVAEGGGGNVTVENHFHIAANGDESVKRIIAQEAPRIANLTQKQIIDQRRRGGTMKAAFG